MENIVKYFLTFADKKQVHEMVKFVGEYKAKVDDKGRIVFPSVFKELVRSDEPVRLVVKKNLFFPCLDIYLYDEWERESEEIKSRLNFFNREHALFWRGYMNGRAIVSPDGKLGRISIPRPLLDHIGATGREVIFSGNDHKIELWAKEAYENALMDEAEFTALAEKILG